MTHSQASPEQAAAIRQCFDAYGGDVDAWPADKRAAYGDLARGAAFREAREAAAALDAALDAATFRPARQDLQNRIIAVIPETSTPTSARGGFLSPLAALLRPLPAGALAGLGALGLASGFVTAGAQETWSPEYEAYAYLEDASVFASTEEAAQWNGD